MGVTVQERPPCLPSALSRSSSAHILLHRSFPDPDIQFEQFPSDALGSPQRIVCCHLPDQDDRLLGYPWPSWCPPGPGCPEEPNALPMPAEEGLGLDDLERLLPCRCHRCHDHQTEAVQRRELRPRDLTAQDEELLAEQGVFSDQGRPGPGQVF